MRSKRNYCFLEAWQDHKTSKIKWKFSQGFDISTYLEENEKIFSTEKDS